MHSAHTQKQKRWLRASAKVQDTTAQPWTKVASESRADSAIDMSGQLLEHVGRLLMAMDRRQIQPFDIASIAHALSRAECQNQALMDHLARFRTPSPGACVPQSRRL